MSGELPRDLDSEILSVWALSMWIGRRTCHDFVWLIGPTDANRDSVSSPPPVCSQANMTLHCGWPRHPASQSMILTPGTGSVPPSPHERGLPAPNQDPRTALWMQNATRLDLSRRANVCLLLCLNDDDFGPVARECPLNSNLIFCFKWLGARFAQRRLSASARMCGDCHELRPSGAGLV